MLIRAGKAIMALHRRARLFSVVVAVAAALSVPGPAEALSPDGRALLSLLPGAAGGLRLGPARLTAISCWMSSGGSFLGLKNMRIGAGALGPVDALPFACAFFKSKARIHTAPPVASS